MANARIVFALGVLGMILVLIYLAFRSWERKKERERESERIRMAFDAAMFSDDDPETFDREKFVELYESAGGDPDELSRLIERAEREGWDVPNEFIAAERLRDE